MDLAPTIKHGLIPAFVYHFTRSSVTDLNFLDLVQIKACIFIVYNTSVWNKINKKIIKY